MQELNMSFNYRKDDNRAYLIIEFGNPYVVDPILIGRKITFCLENKSISSQKLNCKLLFPVQNENCESLLEQPINDLGILPKSWGWVNEYEPDIFPCIKTIVIVVESEGIIEGAHLRSQFFIYVTKILKILRFLYPNSVTRYKTKNLISNIFLQTFENDRRHIRGVEFAMDIMSDATEKRIKIKDVFTAIKNVHKELSLIYSLYDNALDYFAENDYRACVLACTTLIEVLMKRSLIQSISLNVYNQNLVDKLIKDANGYSKINEYLKMFSLVPPIDAKSVFKIRNRIIHGGYSSNEEDALISLKVAKGMITNYNVPLFES